MGSVTNTVYTPGPWEVDDIGAGRAFSVRAGDERHAVAFTNSAAMSKHACKNGIHGDAEQRANARLIAAAPELLEACEMLRGWISTSWGTTSEAHQLKLVQDKVRKALKKATGK